MPQARIYRPTKTAMQSGKANAREWVVEYLPARDALFIEPLMGWTGSSDTTQQIKLFFSTKEEAIAFAKRKKLQYSITEPQLARTSIKAYSDNFTRKK